MLGMALVGLRSKTSLEEDCERFSNIEGITFIPFPRDHIELSFEPVRRVLEREGIL